MNLNQSVIRTINLPLPINRQALAILGVATFVILTFLGAYIHIYLPFTPVPITLQTFFVLLSGAVLGKRLGGISQLGYVILGGLGLPVFAGAGGGIFYLLGPTGGYLIGFVIASYLVGRLVGSFPGASLGWIIFSMLAGLGIIYLSGISWLALIMKISFSRAAALGLLPFIPGAILKLLSAAMIFQHLRSRIDTGEYI